MSLSSIFLRLWRWISPPRPAGDGVVPDTTESPAAEPDGGSVEGSADEFDSAFEAVFSNGGGPGSAHGATEPNRHDRAQNRELFAGIAANHLRPVKDFFFELETGSAPKEWIEICRPVIGSLEDAAESMELVEIAKILKALDKELKQSQEHDGAWPSKAWKERVLQLYGKLVELEPVAFGIDDGDRKRESILVHSLLRQIPDVGYVTLEKLYRVGLTSRETLFLASAKDLVSTAGVPLELSTRIHQELQNYRRATEGADLETIAQGARMRLIERVPVLRRHHEEFKQARDEAGVDRNLAGRKRELRRKRRACSLEIEVILAEMGEVELARKIQALPFEKRIKKLEQYLALPTDVPVDADLSDVDRKPSPTVAGT